jgi:hypothetical protein
MRNTFSDSLSGRKFIYFQKEEFLMKKTLVSALTTALVVGAASTTFAAANPFSDVPADHWAYDAVSQLAADGVIEGYGDTTFRGNQNITRYDASTEMDSDSAKDNEDKVDLKRIWAQGNYNNFQVKLGKFAPIDNDSIFDTTFSGAEVSFGNKVTFTAGAGRKSNTDLNDKVTFDETANYQYAGLGYADGKFVGGVDYHHLNADSINYLKDAKGDKQWTKDDKASIWLAKAAYQFDKTNGLNGFYANNTEADDFDNAWSAQYSYKGAQAENKGTWGMWAAYRNLGANTALFSTFNAILAGQKGWEVGANYAPFKNVVATLRYGNGKDLRTDNDIENLFGRIEMFF